MMRRHKSHAVGDLCKRGSELPGWDALEAFGRAHYADDRALRTGDVRIILYRDANGWCPFCHRVWFALEHKGLRYETRRVHLRSDPREPPKPDWYLDLVPSGAVPALSVDGVVLTESLDILRALDGAVPAAPRLLPEGDGGDAAVERLVALADDYDCDRDVWLRNGSDGREASLRADAVDALERLDAALGDRGGPFFLGRAVSIVDCAYVGFLSRLEASYAFFKNYDLRRHANIDRWFAAMERDRGYRATRTDAAFDQRVYQFDPRRRREAEDCMGLGRPLVDEPRSAPPAWPVARLGAADEADAAEAVHALARNRTALLGFLERSAAPPPPEAPVARRDARGKWAFPPRPPAAASADGDDALRALAALLAGKCADAAGDRGAAAAAAAAGGARVLGDRGPLAVLATTIGTPRDMSAAAAAATRGAVRAMRVAAGAAPPVCHACGKPAPGEPGDVEWSDARCRACVAEVAAMVESTIEL